MSKRNGTDGSLLASLPWTLAALAFSLAPHLAYLPAWIPTVFVACAAGRWYIEKKRLRLPPAWLRIILAIGGFVGVYLAYRSVSGVGPGSALLAIMAALKLLETRQRRDQFVLLFISIFLIMASLLREQYIWSLPFLVAGITLTMTAWLRMSVSTEVTIRESFKTGGRLLLYAAPLTLAMWIFFPRIATPFWSVPIDTGTAASGLNDRMSPGDISSLSLSDEVAFRVDFGGAEPPPPDRRYWRGLVLHRFDGRTWTGNEPAIDFRAKEEIEVSGNPASYRVTLEPTRQQWVFALDIPYQWSLDKAFMGPQQQLMRVQPIDRRVAYDAVSYPEYKTNLGLTPFGKRWYLALPEERNPRTLELAREMRHASRSDEDYIRRVLGMFHDEDYFYTLEPPALGSNPVDRFLFETRRGFCEHYASAFAVLMRAAGLPARIVLGYQGGQMNPKSDYMIVRQSDAHAWTEVWLPGKGWSRYDPTAAVAPERIEAGMSGALFGEAGASWGLRAPALWLYELGLTWDALNAKWNGWILGYGPENQGRLMQWLGMDEPNWRKMMLTLLALVLLLIGGLSLLLMRRYRPPRKDQAARLYRQFVKKTGFRPGPAETPHAFAARVAAGHAGIADEVHAITEYYLAARYGLPGGGALAALHSAVRRFRRAAGQPHRSRLA